MTDPLPTLPARNVLVAIDASAGAKHALAHAIALVSGAHGRLTILTVVPPPSTWVSGGLAPPVDPRVAEDEAAQRLREACRAVPEDVSVTTQLVRGHPAEEIVRRAREGQHDLVVVGSRGHGGLRAALDSVSLRVLAHSPAPVIVVHVADSAAEGEQPTPAS